MRCAYADPPYIGQAAKHYTQTTDIAGQTWDGDEVDHLALLRQLNSEYDAWALSASSTSLPILAAYLPKGARIAAWVKSFAAFKRNVRVAYAWEPVIVKPPPDRTPAMVTTRDFIIEPITMRKGMSGVKPERVCIWIFNLLGMSAEDDLTDLFPGSGAVTQAWERWKEAGTPKLKQTVKVENELIPLADLQEPRPLTQADITEMQLRDAWDRL